MIDSYGAIWVSSSKNSLEFSKIVPEKDNNGDVSYISKNLQLPENYEINSRLAKNSGEEVHFYGTNDGGDEVRGTLDPSAASLF